MNKHEHYRPLACLAVTLSLGFAFASSGSTPVKAQSQPADQDYSLLIERNSRVTFEPPNDGRIDNSRGGASRPIEAKCRQDASARPPLTAVMPDGKQGLTVATHPTVFVYVPKTSATKAYFSLKDEKNKGIYQTTFAIPEMGGVIGVKLPDSQPPLEIGKSYQWSVALMCQPRQTDSPVVQGRVERVEPNAALSTQLQGADLLEQAAIYGKAGFWYDMLASLAQLRKSQPNNDSLAQTWSDVLNSVGLQAIANQPLIQHSVVSRREPGIRHQEL